MFNVVKSFLISRFLENLWFRWFVAMAPEKMASTSFVGLKAQNKLLSFSKQQHCCKLFSSPLILTFSAPPGAFHIEQTSKAVACAFSYAWVLFHNSVINHLKKAKAFIISFYPFRSFQTLQQTIETLTVDTIMQRYARRTIRNSWHTSCERLSALTQASASLFFTWK